jgi:3-oxoacyl-[acyl-carrier protein] reductase
MSKERKTAIVTGAGTGVGAATAKWLAAHGFNVVVNYNRSAQDAETVVAACKAVGADALAVQGNVGEDADCRTLAKTAADRWGRIDALVNSAGTTQFTGMSDLEAINAADFERVFRTNTIAPFQMTRAAAAHMKDGGAVVNISSMSALTANGSSYAYVTSKAALNTLTVAMARTLSPKIRVNAVLPGMIEGRWLKDGLGDAGYEKMKATWVNSAALGQVCTPEQVADVVGWLIVDAPLITGQLINVDAGMLLGKPVPVTR